MPTPNSVQKIGATDTMESLKNPAPRYPMMAKVSAAPTACWIGKGPDTFFAEFPQGDLLGKLYAYDTTQMIVDKPHNLYLQIGINEGGIALLAFLVMMAPKINSILSPK